MEKIQWVFSQHLPLPAPSAGPEAAKPNRTDQSQDNHAAKMRDRCI